MDNKSLIQKYCKFLSEKFNFQLIKIKEDKYSIIAKYKPPKVGLYFIYEYREKFPVLQFTLLDGDDFIIRLGLYTLKSLFQNERYTLKSFYLDEILSSKNLKGYESYFNICKTYESVIAKSVELTELYALDFVSGNETSYLNMDLWFKEKIKNL